MRISELAQKAGLAASAIRYYEEQGLVAPAGRRQNGYRYYNDRAVHQLHIVRVCQSLGFSLDTIRGFLSGAGQCNQAHVLAQVALRTDAALTERAALDAQLTQLAALRAYLEGHGAPPAGCTAAGTQ